MCLYQRVVFTEIYHFNILTALLWNSYHTWHISVKFTLFTSATTYVLLSSNHPDHHHKPLHIVNIPFRGLGFVDYGIIHANHNLFPQRLVQNLSILDILTVSMGSRWSPSSECPSWLNPHWVTNCSFSFRTLSEYGKTTDCCILAAN